MSTIEIPVHADYPEIVSVINAADARFEDIYTHKEREAIGVSNMTAEKLAEWEGSRRYRVLKEEGKIVAFASFRMKDARTVWISFLFVDPDEQRNGYGSVLLSAIEAEAKNVGATRVALATHARALWAISFYLKHGYQISPLLNGDLEESQVAFEKQI